jgi:hypothetical protein
MEAARIVNGIADAPGGILRMFLRRKELQACEYHSLAVAAQQRKGSALLSEYRALGLSIRLNI